MARNWLIAMTMMTLLAGCSSDQIVDTETFIEPPVMPKLRPFYGPERLRSEWVELGDRVFFEFDRSTLTPVARDQLKKWVAFLTKHPKDKLLIEGHADERGTREYNLALGERRAHAVMKFLVAQGVEASRIKAISYGKERPAVLGSNEVAWAQNRRAVGVIQ
jgi:peptidoglycan-associated lipoprotein